MVQDTLLANFSARVAEHPHRPYLHQPRNSQWTSLSWADVGEQARRIASGLLAQGLQPGDRVAILGKNCAEWVISEIAISMAGLISVPIYYTAHAKTVNYVIEHSDVKLVFAGQYTDDSALDELSNEIPRILFTHTTVSKQNGHAEHWRDWLTHHSPLSDVQTADEDDTYTIMYTSGSTGTPKGVVLTHKNVVSAAAETAALYPPGNNRMLSYLPLAHVTERSVVVHTSFYTGAELFFNESLETFVSDLNHCQPTVFLSVPRLWAKFQSNIVAQIPDKKLQRLLSIPLVGRFVARKIRKKLGFTHCQLYLCGSAPMPPALLQWFLKLGIPIGEGWGMTETSGAACANLPFDENSLGTIGKPFANIAFKLADNQELLIRGAGVFSNYYRAPETTAESFDDGWFKTGDRAEQTANGAWKIIGRTKEQFKTAKGKYVSPAPIENLLAQNPMIEQTCVVGSSLPQPVALVVLAELENSDKSELTSELEDTLVKTNDLLESHERLARLLILAEPFSIENSQLTPTLKMRREAIENRYQPAIEAEADQAIIWLD